MFNIEPLSLLKRQVNLRENTIGNTMRVAKIPETMNEARLSSFLAFVLDDADLPNQLTVQERYYTLLNYLAISDSDYSPTGDHSAFFIATQPDDVPSVFEREGVCFGHLTGAHALILEKNCENVFDWLTGAIALQAYGDLTASLGLPDKLIWDEVATTDSQALGDVLLTRFEQIQNLTDGQYTKLYALYAEASDALAHFVTPKFDNDGIALVGGGGKATRFCALSHLPSLIRQLVEYAMERHDSNDGTWANDDA
ncbi:hypothetical protein [Moraxella atlantae]|uniref:Uncharacterized protein n=1 Tax=Faucicola atlantae TaxID=34059 RepID=A0A378Q389_9GAMM|nr:hypothetical protein [Moraxella atlantae]OPH34921.1 hypothetical protein B5J92_06230 [Moraxella atlantae]STY95219.1 Uncharacterised protein [Moraxella atlantae]